MPDYSQEDLALFAEAVLGRDANEFFSTDLGRYVLARSTEEIESARQELERPENEDDHPKLKAYLRKIRDAKTAVQWLNSAILEGKTAELALTQRAEGE